MLTAHTVKILKTLDKKKYRQKYNLFVVEGNKIIRELPYSNIKIKELFSLNPENLQIEGANIHQISEAELSKISFLQHPKDSLAVCELAENVLAEEPAVQLVLDGIQDPGNFGTIIRLADWFGISQMICSKDCVDAYNPKVIQASMGSFLRVNIYYTDLEFFLSETKNTNLGTDMVGENIFGRKFEQKINLILGNEGNGISPDVEKLVSHKITIPRFGSHQKIESLNVSMAAGIILGQIFAKN